MHGSYLEEKRNGFGKPRLSSLHEVTAALRIFAYGCAVDIVDEYVRIEEFIALKCYKCFASVIVDIFGRGSIWTRAVKKPMIIEAITTQNLGCLYRSPEFQQ